MDEFTNFGEAVLRNLDTLVPSGTSAADLALELGLCAWMHQCDTDVDEALDHLWEVRAALLAAADLDPATEPIPFGGRDGQVALLNLVIYLGSLLSRAAAQAGCDTASLVARAEMTLRSATPRFRVGRVRLGERRTS